MYSSIELRIHEGRTVPLGPGAGVVSSRILSCYLFIAMSCHVNQLLPDQSKHNPGRHEADQTTNISQRNGQRQHHNTFGVNTGVSVSS